MACTSCEERRRMIQEGARQGVAGLIRVTPAVVQHLIRKPPIIRAKRPLPKPPITRED